MPHHVASMPASLHVQNAHLTCTTATNQHQPRKQPPVRRLQENPTVPLDIAAHTRPGSPNVPPRRTASSNVDVWISAPMAPCILTVAPAAPLRATEIMTIPGMGGRSGKVSPIPAGERT